MFVNENVSRRSFLKATAAASVAIATAPAMHASDAAQANGQVTLAFLGCAHIHTPQYLKQLKTTPGVRVKFVWDHDTARAAQNAAELGATRVDSPEEICRDKEVDGVVICSETNRHLDLVLAAAGAKKHLFVEKPLGCTAAESYRMADAIERAGVYFNTGYFMRCDPKHLFLKEQIARGSFGKITRVMAWNCHSGALDGWFDTQWRWMADPKVAGVGGFGDLGTHSLDLMMWLLGELEVECVIANIMTAAGRYNECDDAGQAMLKFKTGTAGILVAGWVDVANPVTLQIAGTEGHAVITHGKLFFKSKNVPGADGKEPWQDLPKALPNPLDLFVNAIAGKARGALVTPREAARRVSVMQAMYNSASLGKWVTPM